VTTAALIKPIDDWTDEEKARLFADDAGVWDALAAPYDATKPLRARIEQGDEGTFSRDDVVLALNYVESTRIIMHFALGLAMKNHRWAQEYFSSALCSYCEWRYRDESFEWPAEREVVADDLKPVQERITLAIREHVKVCPNHPMRALETKLAAAHDAIRGWAIECDKTAREIGFTGPYATFTDRLLLYARARVLRAGDCTTVPQLSLAPENDKGPQAQASEVLESTEVSEPSTRATGRD
jgi:hypothetical protein